MVASASNLGRSLLSRITLLSHAYAPLVYYAVRGRRGASYELHAPLFSICPSLYKLCGLVRLPTAARVT